MNLSLTPRVIVIRDTSRPILLVFEPDAVVVGRLPDANAPAVAGARTVKNFGPRKVGRHVKHTVEDVLRLLPTNGLQYRAFEHAAAAAGIPSSSFKRRLHDGVRSGKIEKVGNAYRAA